MCSLEYCKEEMFFGRTSIKIYRRKYTHKFHRLHVLILFLTSKDTQSSGASANGLHYSCQLYSRSITFGNCNIQWLPIWHTPYRCLNFHLPSYQDPSSSHWYGQTLNLIIRKHQTSLALKTFSFHISYFVTLEQICYFLSLDLQDYWSLTCTQNFHFLGPYDSLAYLLNSHDQPFHQWY